MSNKFPDSNQDSQYSAQDSVVQHIGKYEIQGLLGRGSTGVVYLGFDPQLQRKVAIKALHVARSGSLEPISEFQGSQQVVKRFMAEAQSTGRLRHQNIIALHEGNVHGPVPYLVMEYVEGNTLDSLIKSGHYFSLTEFLSLFNQLADAIDYAHSQGVLHRDIKPANILIDSKFKPYILDFGVAKIHEQISAEDEGVRSTSVLGTPAYMSPEQIKNKPLNNQSDLFAFAIVAFQCLCGSRPFEGETFTAVASSILEKFPKHVTSFRSDLSVEVDHVFIKALAKDRAGRFESARQFIKALEVALRASDYSSAKRMNQGQSSASSEVVSKDLEKVKALVGKAAGISPDKISSTVSLSQNRTQASLATKEATAKTVSDSDLKSKSSFTFFLFFIGVLIGIALIVTYFLWPRRNIVIVSGVVISDNQSNLAENNLVVTPLPSPELSSETQEIQQQEEASIAVLVQNILEQSSDSALISSLLSELKLKSETKFHINVTPLLGHSNYLVKVAALKILIERKEVEAVTSILPLLDDADPLVRGFAAKSLGVLANSSYSDVLGRRASKEKVPEVIRALENAIERITERSQ